jgi:hypothetical protein
MTSIETVELARVIRDPAAWPRVTVDPERVALFVDLYTADGADALPPIELVSVPEGTYLLAEGWTRYAAAEALGWDDLPAVVLDVPSGVDPVDVAYERGLEAASTAARPLSRAERRRAVMRLLEANPQRTDREIGRLVGVAHTTVGRARAQVSGASHQADAPEAGTGYLTTAAAGELATRLFKAMEKVWEARGLGLADAVLGDRTGDRLATALSAAYGDDALDRAERYRSWIAGAIRKLRAAR